MFRILGTNVVFVHTRYYSHCFNDNEQASVHIFIRKLLAWFVVLIGLRIKLVYQILLIGTLPTVINGQWPVLSRIDFNSNSLTGFALFCVTVYIVCNIILIDVGSIPTSYGFMTSLTYLDIAINSLSG